MSGKEHQLTKTRDFSLLFKHGRFVGGQFLDLKYLKLALIPNYFPKKEDVEKFKKQLKLAISISIKVSKKAVSRNRLKRQIREALRTYISGKKLAEGCYLLFIVKPAIINKNFADISQEILLLLNKINILHKVEAKPEGVASQS